MKRTLVVATTVFHVLVAIHMKRTVLKSNTVDLILGDETPDIERIIERIQETNIFEDVYFVKMNDYNKMKGKYKKYTPFKYAANKYFDVSRMFKIKKKYDIYLVPFYHHFHMNLYSFMKRFINPHIRVYLYEEGLAIYSGMGKIYRDMCQECNENIAYKTLKYGRMLREIKGVLTFNPQLIQWAEEYKKIKLPMLDRRDIELRNMYNSVFDYHGEFEKDYNKKIVFFEEAKYQDGIKINDIGVVKEIAKQVGEKNILVKRHPRSEENRFEKIGCETNSNTLIPWEVIYMNHDLSKTIFVSTASSSIVHPVILFGEQIKSMFLFKMVHAVLPMELQAHEKFMEDIIVSNYKDCFYIPRNMEEVAKILSKI